MRMAIIPYDSESADAAQKAILKGLFEAGWISKSYESNQKLMLEWTPYGRERLPILQELLQEIGGDDWTPKQRVIGGAILYMSNLVGWDEQGVTVLGDFGPREQP